MARKKSFDLKNVLILSFSIVIVIGGFFALATNMSIQQYVDSITAASAESEKPTVMAVYAGKLPCGDCPGIQATLTFYSNNTYAIDQTYIDRDSDYHEKGTWVLNDSIYTLTANDTTLTSLYKVKTPTTLIQLDGDGKEDSFLSQFPLTLE